MNSFLRVLDFLFSLMGLIILSPLILVLFALGHFDTGAPMFIQTRIGRNMKEFRLVKFRTMTVDTPSVGSHEVSISSITKYGGFLRRTKLDELPQLWNVLKGEMSLVGPRPNLPNQVELISERQKLGVYQLRPGITGLAQVNNIDMSTPELLAETDQKLMQELSLTSYFKYILMTVSGKGAGDATLNGK